MPISFISNPKEHIKLVLEFIWLKLAKLTFDLLWKWFSPSALLAQYYKFQLFMPISFILNPNEDIKLLLELIWLKLAKLTFQYVAGAFLTQSYKLQLFMPISFISNPTFHVHKKLWRFIARRGRPTVIYTDNGTSFKAHFNVGASGRTFYAYFIHWICIISY